jgi:HEAT repeat protein
MSRALARAATQPVRLDWRQEPDYELSSVRLAAVEALRGLAPRAIKPLESEEPRLWALLGWWREGKVDALADCLWAGHESIQPLAALALGEMATEEAAACLVEAFHAEGTQGATRWAVADAMLRLDAATIRDRAILPVLDRKHAPQVGSDVWKRRRRLYDRVAYLTGKARIRHPVTAAFLERCIHEFTDVWIKGRAIRALGRLGDGSYRTLFEEVATGKLGRLKLRKGLGGEYVTYLRRQALLALSDLGNRRTLERLQRSNISWDPELRRDLFWTLETIRMRV